MKRAQPKWIIETSSVMALVNSLFGGFLRFGLAVKQAYLCCFVHKFAVSFVELIKGNNSVILFNSKVGQWLIGSVDRSIKKTMTSLSLSLTQDHAAGIKKDFQMYPFKIIGVIVVSAVLTNLTLSLIFHHSIGLTSLVLGSIFLVFGFCALSSSADWETIKRNSFILKMLIK